MLRIGSKLSQTLRPTAGAFRTFHTSPVLNIKASDLFVKCLEEEGVTHIFGVPGEENADFMMSLRKSDKIRFVLTRHEQGAAFMAEVMGRLSGMPAGCLATLGPGATNLITGVANSNMDNAPMLVLLGQGSTKRLHKESHQIMDAIAMYEPVSKWANSIRHPQNIPEVIRKAVRIARKEKPGATVLELPEDIAKMEVDMEPLTPKRFRRPGPDGKIIKKAYEAIRNAKRPIILAGNGAVRKHSSKQLRRLCEATGMGVISTFMGKGCVDREHSSCLFTLGGNPNDLTGRAIQDADLVITLGYDLVEYSPELWNPCGGKTIVGIDFLPADVDSHYHPDIECVGDLGHTLWELNEMLDQDGVPSHWDFSFQQKCRAMMLEDFALHANDDTVGSIRPQKALWEVRKALGPNDILLSGVGAHKMWIGRYYHCNEPNTCLIPNGFCSMGLPLPGSIAAHLVHPDRTAFVICGDGDFMMNVQEMETAARLKAPIKVMVWEDGGYGLIAWKQENEFHTHTELEFTNPDWIGLAKSFGWYGDTINDAKDLEGAIAKMLAHDGPALLVIPIDYKENVLLTERLGNTPSIDELKKL